MAPWWAPNGKFLKFRLPDGLEMYFSWIFLGIIEFYGEFRKNSTRSTQNFPMRVCKHLNQRVRRTGKYSGKYFKGFSRKTTYEETEFRNSIQESVYRL